MGCQFYSWVKERCTKEVDLKSRDLRHAFGTRYPKEAPGQLREIAGLMDHFNLSQVRKYALSDAERERAGWRNSSR